ncbi:hypothetical protein [Singulisphaera sp. GP187]|uniref:hypothetical protein n=1 Tax=Singulisphaera sp. GP187 TaxID=1882752 RepID=UPI0020B16181|nr:hypothetical protein [Singulisphaera sp. GP187]
MADAAVRGQVFLITMAPMPRSWACSTGSKAKLKRLAQRRPLSHEKPRGLAIGRARSYTGLMAQSLKRLAPLGRIHSDPCMDMLYSTLVKGAFRSWYGEPPDLSAEHEGQGLVLVADGVGGLDLCGTALRYVMGSLGVKHTVRVVPWGHGFGRWHADLTNVRNRDTRACEIAAEVTAFRDRSPGAPVFLVGKSGGRGWWSRRSSNCPRGPWKRPSCSHRRSRRATT